MRNINKGSIAKKTIKKEAQALNQLTKKIDHNFEKACDVLLACKGKIVQLVLENLGM